MNNMEPGATAARFPGWLRVALIGRNPKRTLIRAVILAICCFVFFKFFVFKFIVLPVRIEGYSMFPTYRDWGINFVNRLAYRHAEPQRGDVVGNVLSVCRARQLPLNTAICSSMVSPFQSRI